MKVLRENVHCRSSSSIHIDYNQPFVGGLSVHSTPARQMVNLSLAGDFRDEIAVGQSSLTIAANVQAPATARASEALSRMTPAVEAAVWH
eukprot:6687956-Prymnesium_polylepis.1